jgi:hypothetical protein
MLGWNRITILWLPLGLVLILVLQETWDHLLPTASASSVPSLTTPVAMVEVTGKGYRYWPRWRGPTGRGWLSIRAIPTRGRIGKTFFGRSRSPAAATPLQ